jgi:glutaredoxin
VNKVKPGGAPAASVPLALQQPMRDFPVTLYSSSECAEPCALARAHLNKRGIPFTETPIRDGIDELKRLAPGASQVPALRVGGQVLSGFEAQAYDGALDSAGYPRAGVLAPRAQRAPAEAGEGPPKPEAAKPDESAPQGPYAPGSRPQRQQQKK